MTISVLMSVYEKENFLYLEQCLESLAMQTLKASEVVLVQDGPISPELLLTIERYRGILNIISVSLAENKGLASALNFGLAYCSCDYVARMDSDDLAHPERFSKQLGFMLSRQDIDVCSGIVEEFDQSGRTIGFRILPLEHEDIVNFAKKRSPLSHPAVMFKKQVIVDVGGYPNVYPEDYLLWVKLIQNNYKFANLNTVLVRMRTSDAILKRRGFKFLKGQLSTYRYMYETRFINILEYMQITIMISVLRLSPGFIKVFLYKFTR